MADTPCFNCCFAVKEGKTQTDCKLGLIEKYRADGVEIDYCYNQDDEFFVIKNRICKFARPDSWAKEHAGQDLIKLVKEKASFSVDALIYSGRDSVEDIKSTFDTLIEQEHKPKQVVIISDNESLLPSSIIKSLGDDISNPSFVYKEMPYKISYMIGKKGRNLAVDQAATSVSTPWMMVCNAGDGLENKVFKQIDVALNERLERFVCVKSDGGSIILMLYPIFKLFGLNLEKLQEVCEEDKCTHLVKNLREVCKQ